MDAGGKRSTAEVYFCGDLDNNSVTKFIDDSKTWSAVSQYGDRIVIQSWRNWACSTTEKSGLSGHLTPPANIYGDINKNVSWGVLAGYQDDGPKVKQGRFCVDMRKKILLLSITYH